MKPYISNIIKHLTQFSASFDKQEIFIDKPWVIIDENPDHLKYIFRKDGSLIISLNGQVTIGKWEYIQGAKSLLIDRIQDKILLNPKFIDSAVLVLTMDGLKDDFFILANELIIPDLDVSNYLKELYYQKKNIKTLDIGNGEYLEIQNYEGDCDDNLVTIEGESIKDAVYRIDGKNYYIVNSLLKYVHAINSYKTDKGIVDIEFMFDNVSNSNGNLLKGDNVFINNTIAPDGKYKLSSSTHFTVENGSVKHISWWVDINGIDEKYKV